MLMRCLEPVFPRIAGPTGGGSGLSPAQPSLLRSGAIARVASLSKGPQALSAGPGGWAQLPRKLRMKLERGKCAEEGDMTPAIPLGGPPAHSCWRVEGRRKTNEIKNLPNKMLRRLGCREGTRNVISFRVEENNDNGVDAKGENLVIETAAH